MRFLYVNVKSLKKISGILGRSIACYIQSVVVALFSNFKNQFVFTSALYFVGKIINCCFYIFVYEFSFIIHFFLLFLLLLKKLLFYIKSEIKIFYAYVQDLNRISRFILTCFMFAEVFINKTLSNYLIDNSSSTKIRL